MRVSTFFAPTLPDAMAQVRAALGPRAVVLSWRNTRGGVEISASVASAPEPSPTPPPKEKKDRLADHFAPHDLIAATPPQPARTTKPAAKPPERGLSALVARQPAKSQKPAADAPPLRPAPTQAAPASPNLPLHDFLVRAGLSRSQAEALGRANTAQLQRALLESLTQALTFEPIDAVPPKPLVLVGPAGAGKSACVAKLAARTLACQHEVLVVSADSERCGGAEQLRALAERLGARFEAVATLADLNDLIAQARSLGMVVIVDAPSASPTQPADMRAIGRLIEQSRLEPILCLPADLHPDDLLELALAYKDLGVSRAIATRLDLTKRRACVLHVLHEARLALAQVSTTPFISGGVAIATPARVAGLLLEPFDDALSVDAA